MKDGRLPISWIPWARAPDMRLDLYSQLKEIERGASIYRRAQVTAIVPPFLRAEVASRKLHRQASQRAGSDPPTHRPVGWLFHFMIIRL
jgi:hypothetical protein